MGFFFMWPVLAVRDTFHLELLLTSRIIAYLYLGLWSVAGSLAVIADLRHGIRIDLLGATGGFVFCGLWLINFFAYPVTLDHEAIYHYYALVYCICPFIVGLLLPTHYLRALGQWLGIASVSFCAVLLVPHLQGAVPAFRNWMFASINPITEATHLGVGLICLTCPGLLKMPRVLRVVAAGVVLWQLVLTSSRGPIVGVILALLVMTLNGRGLRWSERFALLSMLGLAGGLFVFVSGYLPDEVRLRLLDVDHSLYSVGAQGGALVRVDPIVTALRLGLQSPFFGSGLSQNSVLGFYSHNLFSQAFLEVGAVGVLGLLVVLARSFQGYARGDRYRDKQVVCFGGLFLFYLFVHQFSFTAILALQLWFLAGVGTRLCGGTGRAGSPRIVPVQPYECSPVRALH